jgi:radical SAM superfamily enzyme YgiQ (UPF0313 family)
MDMARDTVILFHPRSSPGDVITAIPYEFLNLERMVRTKVTMVLIDEQKDPDYSDIVRKYYDRLLLAGVSTMTGYQLKGARDFSLLIKSLGQVPVVWGSWHPSLLPEETLKETFVDYVVSGQGEIAFQRLVEALLNRTAVDDIPNLGYKQDGTAVVNKRDKIRNPNDFPPIDLDKIDIAQYVTRKRTDHAAMWYFASFGCPNACGFCSMANVFGSGWWHRPVKEIMSHLQYLKEKTGMGVMRFQDPTFFVKRDFTLELCNALIDSDMNIQWHANAQAGRFVKLFNDEDIALMYRSGLRQVFVGAESGDPEVLLKMNKESTVEDNLEIVRRFKKAGVRVNYSTMMCFPWNPQRDFKLTARMIMKAKLIDRRLELSPNFFKPLPGTPLFETSKQLGFIPPDSLEGWARYVMNGVKAPWATKNALIKLRILKRIYFPLMTPGVLSKIRGVKKLVFLFLILSLRPIVWLRFKMGCMSFPLEGYLIYYSILAFNRITGLNWGLEKAGRYYMHRDF